uniref:DNA-directed DNA polymerase n=1 Tax=Coniferiporia sulphurascens TaxID=175648 RepID=A0A5B9RKC1_CONSH|nr:DNA polymerase family B [Coniferiporia sulphurascens]QEG57195.1 DNA polymerase family B [Coniferiporia sulphurascens]
MQFQLYISNYPFAMLTYDFPTKLVYSFNGPLSPKLFNLDDILGIYHVKVKAPDNIAHPILPHKVNNKTIFGIGNWTGWYFSEEIKNAETYGYRFEILEGYLFEKENIFSGYINDLYERKQNSDKSDPMYLIAKILMNSLFGRFGLSTWLPSYSIKNVNDFNELIQNFGVDKLHEAIDFDDNVLFAFNTNTSNSSSNSNIAVALAVSAYSRIIMSQFKNNPQYNLYYSDTDSIFIDKELNKEFVDPKILGKFSLEHKLTKFIGLGAKMYGGIDDRGKSFTKVKGLKSKISIEELELLLKQDAVKVFNQNKWFKSLTKGSIEVKLSPYSLKPNSNKRLLNYDNGILKGEGCG